MVCRVLITGGAGFIGSHLADALLSSGRQVRALDVAHVFVLALDGEASGRAINAKTWGTPDDRVRERAHDYLGRLRVFSDVQENAPLPLVELERKGGDV